MTEQRTARRRTLAAVVGAAVASAALSFTAPKEGVSLTPYTDHIASNVQTVCFGETQVEMRRYTLAECRALLDGSLAGYAEAVPMAGLWFDELEVGQKVAAIDIAYNVGLANYRTSTLRTRYAARDFPGACDEFIKWRFVNRKDCAIATNNCMGIVKRRYAERDACLGK
jgi:lysozyme